MENSLEYALPDKLRILILEDSDLDLELLRIQLKNEFEFEDRVIFKKDLFLETIEEFKPHVILSDYSMPQFNGLEALKILREKDLKIPFIIVTGAIDEETAVNCIKSGADDYLLKDRLTRLPEAIKYSIQHHHTELEKERSLRALEESLRNFRALGEAIPDYVLHMNKEGLLIYSNQKKIFNNEISHGTSIFPNLPNEISQVIKNGMEEAYQREKGQAYTVHLNFNGSNCYYRCKIHRIYKEEKTAEFMVMLSDISDIEEAKIDLELTHSRLRDLLNRLELIRDEEKKRISMEIHDQLGQELTANKLGLFYLKQHLSENRLKEKEIKDSLLKVDELISLSTNTIQTVRRIAHQLRPIILDDLGLIPALEWMVKKFNENTDISWQINSEIDGLEFGNNFTNTSFRIVQEAITNVVRHSEANNCSIEIHTRNDELMLKIADDGKGFDLDEVKKTGKLGLFGIEERIKPWNGSLSINSQKEKGTSILVKFPISELMQVR